MPKESMITKTIAKDVQCGNDCQAELSLKRGNYVERDCKTSRFKSRIEENGQKQGEMVLKAGNKKNKKIYIYRTNKCTFKCD